MITLRELLADDKYKEYFLKVPVLPDIARTAPPWRLYVQREASASWARKDFETYREAFKRLKSLGISEIHDATIQSRAHAYYPPLRRVKIVRNGQVLIDPKTKKPLTRIIYWKAQLPGEESPHRWCPYCRRPTIFTWFMKHHAFPRGTPMDPSQRRCTICGASERAVESYGA